MVNYKKVLNYQEFIVGQTWTDGVGIMEIIKIKIPTQHVLWEKYINPSPNNEDQNIIIELELIGPNNFREEQSFSAIGLRSFLQRHEKRIVPINLWPNRKEIEIEDCKDNRFDIID